MVVDIARVVSVVIFVSMAPADAGQLMSSLVGVSVAPLVGLSFATSVANCARTFTFFRCPSCRMVALFEVAVKLFDLDSICSAMDPDWGSVQ